MASYFLKGCIFNDNQTYSKVIDDRQVALVLKMGLTKTVQLFQDSYCQLGLMDPNRPQLILITDYIFILHYYLSKV